MLQNFVHEICSHMLGVGIGCLKVGCGYNCMGWVQDSFVTNGKTLCGQGSIPLKENVNWLVWLITIIIFLGFCFYI